MEHDEKNKITEDGKEQKKLNARRKRAPRNFPSITFEDTLEIAKIIQEYASGQKIRRLTLFDYLGKSPDSGPSKQLIRDCIKYGLIEGGASSEYIELTQNGYNVSNNEVSSVEKTKSKFELAIRNIDPFYSLYDQYKDNKLPAKSVMSDFLEEQGMDKEWIEECINFFIINAKYVGLLKLIAGAERLLPIEHIVDEQGGIVADPLKPSKEVSISPTPKKSEGKSHWKHTCFYIAPIGDDDSEHRMHSDLFLNHIVEPSVKEFDLEVVRADKISEPGIITSQIIEYIVNSKLVIADLSFHNPNVFYELSLRHACRLPTVQLIRKSDKIPFDLDQFRTIQIDTSSIYTLVPRLEVYRLEITEQVRKALNDPDSVDNPISTYSKSLRVVFD